MPPEMTRNEKTGFLESQSVSSAVFTSDKKLKFMEIAMDISRNQGIIPNINDLAATVGIDPATFYRHCSIDSAFKDAWNQCLLNVEAHLQSKMTEFAQRPGNYMDRITALRRIAPQRWNPEYKVTTEVNHNVLGPLADKADAIDAVVSPAIAPQIGEGETE